MKTTCSKCGATNALWRVALYWTGMHIRCHACGAVYRLVETVSGIFAPVLVFCAVYIGAFWLLLDWPALVADDRRIALVAALPAFPGALAAVWTVGRLHRLGPPTDEGFRPLSGAAFVAGYLAATLAGGVAVGVAATGILLATYGSAVAAPPTKLLDEPVAITDADAERFAFVDSDGVQRTLAQLRGEVLFVHLFRVDDPDAKFGLLRIRDLRKAVLEHGVRFVLLAQTDADGFAQFVASDVPKLPFVHSTAPLPGAFHRVSEGLPATFVVDRNGRIVYAHVGLANWAMQQFEDLLTTVARAR